jgi:hypothetical protein
VVQPVDVGRCGDTGQGERLRMIPIQDKSFRLLQMDERRGGASRPFYVGAPEAGSLH